MSPRGRWLADSTQVIETSEIHQKPDCQPSTQANCRKRRWMIYKNKHTQKNFLEKKSLPEQTARAAVRSVGDAHWAWDLGHRDSEPYLASAVASNLFSAAVLVASEDLRRGWAGAAHEFFPKLGEISQETTYSTSISSRGGTVASFAGRFRSGLLIREHTNC